MSELQQKVFDNQFDGSEFQQILVFTRWCNKHLSQINQQIIQLNKDFSNGIKLIELIEILFETKLKPRYKYPMIKKMKLENVSQVLRYLEDQNVDVDGIGKSVFELCKSVFEFEQVLRIM